MFAVCIVCVLLRTVESLLYEGPQVVVVANTAAAEIFCPKVVVESCRGKLLIEVTGYLKSA